MRICDDCFRRHWVAKINRSTGLQVKHKNGNLVYICVNCGNVQEEEKGFIPLPKKIQANILYIDTENSTSIYENYGAKVPSKSGKLNVLVFEEFILVAFNLTNL